MGKSLAAGELNTAAGLLLIHGEFTVACLSLLVALTFSSSTGWAQPVCRPFLFYRGLAIPDLREPSQQALPPTSDPQLTSSHAPSLPKESNTSAFDLEGARLTEIGKKRGPEFGVAYHAWQASVLTKQAWLTCVYPYLMQDSDHDGLGDWTALTDEQPAALLTPLDPDIDNDGLDNIIDPKPFENTPAVASSGVPEHLRVKTNPAWESAPDDCGGGLPALQERLYNDYQLLALEHTDSHAACVLEAFRLVLAHGLPRHFLSQLGNLKYVYAFAGHDKRRVIASYHPQMQAISIGGSSVYRAAAQEVGLPQAAAGGRSSLSPVEHINLVAAIAHEVAHAFILGALQPEELLVIASKFGGFPELANGESADSFYKSIFFQAHKFYDESRRLSYPQARATGAATLQSWQPYSIVSHYALSNTHEWFAEAFAAHVLQVLGGKGALGERWQGLLERAGLATSDRWTNYHNLSPALSHFLNSRMNQQALP